MRPIALVVAALAPFATGCFVSLGNVALLDHERPLEETTVEGE